MTTIALQSESPSCNSGLFTGFAKTSLTDGVFLPPGSIQMRIGQSRERFNATRKQVTPEDMRQQCAFRLQRMATPQTAHDGGRKAQFNKLAKLTGLGVRRVEKLFRGYVLKPLAHEYETIERAYCDWLTSAKAKAIADLRDIETEGAELERRVADYASSRWERACADRTENRALGDIEADSASSD